MKSHGIQGTLLQNVAVFNYLKLQWSFELERVLFCLEKWRSWTALFGFLLTFPQESAGLRKDFPDFTRNGMSPELGVPCLVIRGKEFVNKGLPRPPCLPTLSVPSFAGVVVFCLMVHTSWDPLRKQSELSMAVSPHFLMKPPISYKTYRSVRKEAPWVRMLSVQVWEPQFGYQTST